MEPVDYYQQLGITRDATESEIRAAYRRLVRELHPDALPPETPERVRAMAEVEFARLQEAYEVLSDPISRTTYEDVQTNWALVAHIDRRPAHSSRPWVMPVASAVTGAAIAITGVALANGLANKHQPVSQTIEFRAADAETAQPEAAGPAGAPETKALAEGFASEADSFSRGELTRFAATAIEIKPVVQSVEQRLQAAQNEIEREQIEREFDIEATKIIEANGLTTETYQAIARVAQSDATIRQAVTTAAARLQGG